MTVRDGEQCEGWECGFGCQESVDGNVDGLLKGGSCQFM